MKAIMFKANEINLKEFWLKNKIDGIEFYEDFIKLCRRVNLHEATK